MPTANPQRDLLRISLDLLVLSELVDGPRHGYALIKRIRSLAGEPVGPGTLYPLLHGLEQAGDIAADWDRSTKRERKVYHITEAGRARLKRTATQWQTMLARLQSVILPALRRVARDKPGEA